MSHADTAEQFEQINAKLGRVIDGMSTKDDLAELRAEMRAEMATKAELRAVKEDLETKLDERFRAMMVAIDGLMKPISELKMEYTGISMQLSRYEERLVKLENK